MFPGQTEAQANTDSANPKLSDPGSSTANFIVPETSFPCESGQETCADQQRVGKTCSEVKKALTKKARGWQSHLSRDTDEFKKWDKTYCPSPHRSLNLISFREIKCLGEKILQYPTLEIRSYCTGADEASHRISAQVSWTKTCLSCQGQHPAGSSNTGAQ